ncbi:MAG: hypothetical protein M3246_01970 [Actinomycetota bacterium]|nr:hypothetical protein [Actinomycetota bacterium]
MSIITALLQGGFPVVFLFILVFVAIIAFILVAAATGRAAGRNPNRPGGGGEDERGESEGRSRDGGS